MSVSITHRISSDDPHAYETIYDFDPYLRASNRIVDLMCKYLYGNMCVKNTKCLFTRVNTNTKMRLCDLCVKYLRMYGRIEMYYFFFVCN